MWMLFMCFVVLNTKKNNNNNKYEGKEEEEIVTSHKNVCKEKWKTQIA